MPLMAGSFSTVLTVGWTVRAVLPLMFCDGEYVILSRVTQDANHSAPTLVDVT